MHALTNRGRADAAASAAGDASCSEQSKQGPTRELRAAVDVDRESTTDATLGLALPRAQLDAASVLTMRGVVVPERGDASAEWFVGM